ncbi:MAG: hypothetical protein RBR14_05615 [Candidatus Cloacimonas acidaminovorans]|nr:hypothetical protein [Candidatus Cloacimonas acidaminovorans]
MLNADISKVDGTGAQGARMKQGVNEYIYIKVPATTPAGTPLVVTHDGDEEIMVKGVAAATAAFYQEIAVTPRLAGAAAEFMWCQVKGIGKMLVNGTTDVAKDDYLEVLNTGTAAVKDGATRTVNSVAIACEDQAANANTLTLVQLLGDRVIIAAS